MGAFDSITGALTLGLVNPKTPNYAGAAKRTEAQRQAIINQGLQNINAVFGGGTADFYSPYTTKASRGDALPSLYGLGKEGTFSPFSVSGIKGNRLNAGTGAGIGAAAGSIFPGIGTALGAGVGAIAGGLFGKKPLSPLHNLNVHIGRGDLYTKDSQTFQGFGPDFYDKQIKAYEDFALPQLAEQAQSTQDQVLFGLQNRGLQGSSAQDKALSQLALESGRGKQQIADTALSQANDLRTKVEQARQNAINQLYQTGDPSQAAQSAISSAAGFGVPQAYAPLLNSFSNIANQYAMQQLYNPNVGPQYSNPTPSTVDLGWFGKTVQ